MTVAKSRRFLPSLGANASRLPTVKGGLLGSDANFITMQSIAPEGRAKGTMNLDSDPKNPSAPVFIIATRLYDCTHAAKLLFASHV